MTFHTCDRRIDSRANFSLDKISNAPNVAFPDIFPSHSDLVGFYRLINNPRLSINSIMPKCSGNLDNKNLLCLHDTTELSIGKLGLVDRSKYFFHPSLVVTNSDESTALGIESSQQWISKSAVPNKRRWWEQAIEVSSKYPEIIHVMDREADGYETYGNLVQKKCSFVIRTSINRRLKSGKLFEKIQLEPVVSARRVQISKRKGKTFTNSQKIHPSRKTRRVDLNIQFLNVNFPKTERARKKPTHSSLPEIINLNVVRAFEVSPPKGEKPIEWYLVTNLDVNSENVLEIVDIYRRRWLIEEFFKALKTGCRLEARQFETKEAWEKLTIFLSHVAIKLLNIRYLEKEKTDSIGSYLSEVEQKVLQMLAKKSGRRIKNLNDIKTEIAKLGGHLKSNGPPGWIVLYRGYQKLNSMSQGLSLFQEMC